MDNKMEHKLTATVEERNIISIDVCDNDADNKFFQHNNNFLE